MKIAKTPNDRSFSVWEVVMPRYLTVESVPVSISCYTCGAGFAFVTYEEMNESRCTQCSTPLFLPHELEGVACKRR